MSNPKNYLIVSITENCHRAFESNPPVWGFTEREKLAWDTLLPGDIVYVYGARKARGVLGKGIILNKFLSRTPYWREEIENNIIRWPLKFYFNPVILLPPEMWFAGLGITVPDLINLTNLLPEDILPKIRI